MIRSAALAAIALLVATPALAGNYHHARTVRASPSAQVTIVAGNAGVQARFNDNRARRGYDRNARSNNACSPRNDWRHSRSYRDRGRSSSRGSHRSYDRRSSCAPVRTSYRSRCAPPPRSCGTRVIVIR